MAAVNNRALSFFHPPDRLNIWQWAERHRFLAKGVSAKSREGAVRYSTSYAPHQREPQEAPTDPAVQITVYVMASQIGGKTEMLNNCLGYHMHHRPTNCFMLRPTLQSAEKYSKKKFTPMVDATPVLKELLRPNRSRDSGNTILVKEFAGGSVFFLGANSPSDLRGDSGGVLLGDEIDAYEASAGGEGDPVELLWKRGESFPNAVKIVSSTPTIGTRDENGISLSPIWAFFEISDQRYWFVPCPKCGQWQQLTWKQIVWPKDTGGKHLTERAELLCAHCAAGLSDQQRIRMYYDGRWQPTAEFTGTRGFHLNGIYCPWPALKGYKNRLHQMADESLKAKRKGAFALRVWVNTFLCEPFEDESEKPYDPANILKRIEKEGRYAPDNLPEGVILLLCAVDVQKDRLELEVIGLGLDDETWGVEYVKLYGDTEQDEVWDNLTEQLTKTYRRRDGVELKIKATAIDTQYHAPAIRRWLKRCGIRQGDVGYPGIYLVQGKGNPGPLLVVRRFNKQYHLRIWSVDTKQAKDTLFARLKIEDPGPRFLHYPNGHGYGEEYSKGLLSEVIKRKRERGRIVESYEKITTATRNEPLDLRVYFLAAVDILRPNLTALAKTLNLNRNPNLDPGAEGGQKTSRDYVLKPAPESGAEPAKPARPTKLKRPKPGGGFNPLGL